MKRVFKFIVKVIHKGSGILLYKFDTLIEKKKKRRWLANFAGDRNFFVHNLDTNVQLCLHKDSLLARYIYEGFEEKEISVLRSLLKNGDIFIDVGCNIGLFSMVASKIVGERGRVFCFEPAPVIFERLLYNVQLNQGDNITCINQALSDHEKPMLLNVSNNGYDAWNSFAPVSVDKVQSSVSVIGTTLDKAIENYNIEASRIAFIKIDVEGWEKFVLMGGKDFFKSHAPIIMLEFTESNTFSAGYMVQELYDILANWGYKWFSLTGNGIVEHQKRLHYPYENLIAAKDTTRLKNILHS
jgi:FkbM family methyltransferase